MLADAECVLSQSPLLAGLPEERVARLEAAASRVTYRRGDVIFRQGHPDDALCLIEEGNVKMSMRTAARVTAVVGVLGPGECLDEIGLIDGAPRAATAEALTRVRVATVPR